MRKLIHSKFELDLSSFKISDTEENNWFSDSFFTKYSFPFEIDLTADLDVAFDFISVYNAVDPQTYFECKYVHNDTIQDAIFEIEQMDEKLSCTLRFGFEQLPSFDKKLSELSLENFNLPLGITIYEHAETIITKTWPDVNYNFPQIHTDKFDTETDEWAWFEKIINNRKDGAFLINEIDIPNQYTYNRNIIQPLPYFLHILKRGMLDAGYILSGKILDDQRLKKATLYADGIHFYENILKEYSFDETIHFVSSEFNGIFHQDDDEFYTYKTHYYKSYIIEGIGQYRITSHLLTTSLVYGEPIFRVKLNGIIVFEYSPPVIDTYYSLDFNFYPVINTTLDSNILEIEIVAGQLNGPIDYPFYAYINPVNYYDSQNNPFITIINENKVNLTKSVPDITFGYFVKVIKNWLNYDLTIDGKFAIMNPVEDEINYDNAISLQYYEVEYPIRKFSQGTSFLLKFNDIENKDYIFLPVFQTRDSVVNSGYVVNDKTTTIEVNALPLPSLTRNGSTSAYAFESNDSKVYLVAYDGIYNGNNLAQPNDDYLIPSVHLKYWEKWFNFRISSQSFNWIFKVWSERMVTIKAKTKIFAYNNYHIIKTINKTEIKPDLFEVELETEALK